MSKSEDDRIVTGSYLGDMTDELEKMGPGSHGVEFVSGGPKNYGLKVYNAKKKQIDTIFKCKGFRLVLFFRFLFHTLLS